MTVEHKFPLPVHTFLPCDRDFGVIGETCAVTYQLSTAVSILGYRQQPQIHGNSVQLWCHREPRMKFLTQNLMLKYHQVTVMMMNKVLQKGKQPIQWTSGNVDISGKSLSHLSDIRPDLSLSLRYVSLIWRQAVLFIVTLSRTIMYIFW